MNDSPLLNANHCRLHGLNERNKDLPMFIFRCFNTVANQQ